MLKQLLFIFTIGLVAACNSNEQPDAKLNQPTMDSTSYQPLEWVNNTNIYEVNVRQYTEAGTFNAFEKELPRLKDMGVKVLWFMPITPIGQMNKKGTLGSYYAAADYTSINPEFGTLEDFKNLVKSAHDQGFKVIIDWVANHTGWDHVWTKSNPEYFLKDSATGTFKIASGMEDIIELDYSNPEMVKAMIEAMKFWVKETDIDGFRCDLAFWVELDFWKKARKEVDAVKPLFWFAENDTWEHPEYMQVFDASYTWKWMHMSKDYYQQQYALDSLTNLLNFYEQAPGLKSWFTTNHDENSWNGTEYEKYGHMAGPLAVFSCTWNGIPLIYSGQELPNRKRLEFFERDPIEWTGNYELHDFYKTLLNLRTNNPALQAGKTSTTTLIDLLKENKVLAYVRENGNKQVVVVLNLSAVEANVTLASDKISGSYKNVFTQQDEEIAGNAVSIPAWGYLVYEK